MTFTSKFAGDVAWPTQANTAPGNKTLTGTSPHIVKCVAWACCPSRLQAAKAANSAQYHHINIGSGYYVNPCKFPWSNRKGTDSRRQRKKQVEVEAGEPLTMTMQGLPCPLFAGKLEHMCSPRITLSATIGSGVHSERRAPCNEIWRPH